MGVVAECANLGSTNGNTNSRIKNEPKGVEMNLPKCFNSKPVDMELIWYVSGLSNSELQRLKKIVEQELHLSEEAIKEGNEERE